jgi:hypothetical protein
VLLDGHLKLNVNQSLGKGNFCHVARVILAPMDAFKLRVAIFGFLLIKESSVTAWFPS